MLDGSPKWVTVLNVPLDVSRVSTIGTQILIKNETFGLKQDFSSPPGGGGGGQEIIGIWEKKIRIIGI